MVIAAAALVLVLAAANLPTPLAATYAARFALDAVGTATLYVAYVVGVVAALVVVPALSRLLGERAVAVAGVVLAALAVVGLAMAPTVAALLTARAALGVAVGLASATLTGLVPRLVPVARARSAADTATAAATLGIAVGAAVSGAVAQWWPAAWTYVCVIVAVLLVLLAGILTAHRPAVRRSVVTGAASAPRGPAALAVLVAACSWALMGTMLALLPSFAERLGGVDRPAVVGVVLGLVFGVCTATQWGLQRVEPPRRVLLGVCCLLVTTSTLAIGAARGLTWLLVVAGILGGAAHALAFSGAVALVAPCGGRAVATLLLWSYVGNALPSLGVGALARLSGLTGAVVAFVVLLTAVLGAVLVLLLRHRRRTRPVDDRQPRRPDGVIAAPHRGRTVVIAVGHRAAVSGRTPRVGP